MICAYSKSAASSNAAYNAAYIWTLALSCGPARSRENQCAPYFSTDCARVCVLEKGALNSIYKTANSYLKALSTPSPYNYLHRFLPHEGHEAFDRER